MNISVDLEGDGDRVSDRFYDFLASSSLSLSSVESVGLPGRCVSYAKPRHRSEMESSS